MSEGNETLGYGSLILPTSVMRIDDRVGKAKPKYDKNRRYSDPEILRDSAKEAWEDEKDRIDIIPVRIDGVRRNYNLESSYGGTMLDTVEDEKSWINGVLIKGLTEEEFEELDSSEESYELKEIGIEDINPYLEEHQEELPETGFNIYMGEPEPTDRVRNFTYHDRIHTGADMLKEMYGEELGEKFWNDFEETTFETPFIRAYGNMENGFESYDDWERWSNTVWQNDRSLEAFNWLIDSIEQDYELC